VVKEKLAFVGCDSRLCPVGRGAPYRGKNGGYHRCDNVCKRCGDACNRLYLCRAFSGLGARRVYFKAPGERSGFRGLFLGALLGTAIHGPLVGVFPLLKTLLNKGARLGVVIAIVSTWAIKVPMIPLELRFFGWKFTLVRQLLLFASAFVMAPIMERLIKNVPVLRESKEEE